MRDADSWEMQIRVECVHARRRAGMDDLRKALLRRDTKGPKGATRQTTRQTHNDLSGGRTDLQIRHCLRGFGDDAQRDGMRR